MTLFENIADRARKRALYRQTVSELSALSTDIALDLDIYQGDIKKIAHRAVYGF